MDNINMPLVFPPDADDVVTASPQLMSNYVFITPAIAKAMLKHNVHNRSLRLALVRELAADMRQNRFDTTHQGIAFYKNGDLADGQHRLTAIVEAGVPVMMMVTLGLEYTPNIDTGRKRTELDAIGLANDDLKWAGNRGVAVVNVLKTAFPGCEVQTVSDKAAYLGKYSDAFLFALGTYTCNLKNLSSSAINAAFFLGYVNHVDLAAMKRAAVLLSSGIPSDPADPVMGTMLVLRNYLLKYGGRSGDIRNKTVLYAVSSLLSKYAAGKNVSRVIVPTVFPFSVPTLSGGMFRP